jgi:hypothetical protein
MDTKKTDDLVDDITCNVCNVLLIADMDELR